MKPRLVRILFGLLCVLCLMACSDDEKGRYVPPYITDLVMLRIGADGCFESVTLDNGSMYDVRSQQLTADIKDTVLRCKSTYTLEQGTMRIYGLERVFCSRPVGADTIRIVVNGEVFEGCDFLPRDPMHVVSLWKSGGYVNMHLALMTTGKGMHRYAFCEDSVGHYSLLHYRPQEDEESYKEHVYLSMPIPQGVDNLTFAVHTYDGIYTKEF